ncbi:MAG: AMP-binding protein, partial [Planctomycetota bacterium]
MADTSQEQIYWRPSEGYINNSNLKRILGKFNISYNDFFKRSIADPEWFWTAFLDDIGFIWFQHFRQVVNTSRGKQFPDWFSGGKTNWVYSALHKWATLKPEKIAIVSTNERGERKNLTYKELLELTERIMYGLLKKGARKGDRIGIYMSMVPETVATFLAISAIGAIVVPLFSGFGAEPICVRLADAEAKFLFSQNEIIRKGKKIDTFPILEAVIKNTPSIEKAFILDLEKDKSNSIFLNFNELIGTHKNIALEGFDSSTPFMLIYTSGTTGKPKATVHTHTGFPIKSAQDMYHLFDVKDTDRVFWLTDLGWMMGPWLVCGTLLLGATMVLYDGAPDYPAAEHLWQVIDENNVSICGISPTFIRCQLAVPNLQIDKFNFSALRILGSTGEPWNPTPWQWTIDKIGKGRCPIINYSGGTEISGGILGCTVLHPLK